MFSTSMTIGEIIQKLNERHNEVVDQVANLIVASDRAYFEMEEATGRFSDFETEENDRALAVAEDLYHDLVTQREDLEDEKYEIETARSRLYGFTRAFNIQEAIQTLNYG